MIPTTPAVDPLSSYRAYNTANTYGAYFTLNEGRLDNTTVADNIQG